MRTIAEVAEDIKSILNSIERTEECNGETLVDINEFIDEILSIDAQKRKETEAAKMLFDRIYRNDCFLPNEIEFFNKIEEALGFRLFFWQKTFLITGHFRQIGATTAECLKRLFSYIPIDYSRRPSNAKEWCERNQMIKIKEQLQRAGVETVPILTRIKDVRDYKAKAALDGLNVHCATIDETHLKFLFEKQEGE